MGILRKSIVVAVIISGAIWYFHSSEKTPSTISISASESVDMKPDTAHLFVGIVAHGETTKEVSEKVEIAISQFIDYLSVQEVKKTDIKALQVEVKPRQRWDKATGRQEIDGYTASRTVEVKVRDFEQAGVYLVKASEMGFNNIRPIEPSIEDVKTLQEEAIELAMKKARSSAEAAGRGGRFSVGSIQSVQVNQIHIPRPMHRGGMRMMETAALSSDSQMTVSPGELSITANVSVVFEIDND